MIFLDKEHILFKSKENNSSYYLNFIEMIDFLKPKLTKSEFNKLLKNDLQINRMFNEQPFYQIAIESTVNYYFARKFEDFNYEKKSETSSKDVDCQFTYNDYIYNIEVKCPEFSLKENNITYAQVASRSNSYTDIKNTMKKLKENSNNVINIKLPTERGGVNLKDFTLYDYLISLHNKSGINSQKKINVLIISLYGKNDFSDWYRYLFFENGLFTNESVKNSDDYKNVDLVVLNNSVNRHLNCFETDESAWLLENHFNFIIENPFSEYNKKIGKKNFKEQILKNSYLNEDYWRFYNDKVTKLKQKNDVEYLKRIVLKFIEIKKIPLTYKWEFIFEVYFKSFVKALSSSKSNKNIPNYVLNDLIEIQVFGIIKYINLIEKNTQKKFFNEGEYMYRKMK